MTPLLDLLTAGMAAGLKLGRENDRLDITGPRNAEPLAQQLLARKAAVLAVLPLLDGTVPALDWSATAVKLRPAPCTRCGRPCRLLDPYDGQPSHKLCFEREITDIAQRQRRTA